MKRERTAIVGRWKAPNAGISRWALDWALNCDAWSSPRVLLAKQLRYIRRAHGAAAAAEFSDYLTWLGAYPVRVRRPV